MALIAMSSVGPSALASEIGANDFRISDMGPDGDPDLDAVLPAVAYNPTADEYLVVWLGDDDTGSLVEGELEIFGQRLDASTGVEVGANDFRISDMGPDGNVNFGARTPAVAYNPSAEEYLVVWYGDDDTGFLVDEEFEIFGQRLDGATGAEVGDNDFRISDMGPDGSENYGGRHPAVVYNATAGEYLVVWRGDDDTGFLVDGDLEIFGQRLDGATGAEVGDNDFHISDMGPDGDPDFGAGFPAVAYNPSADEYLVVWLGDDDTGSLVEGEFEIFGQRLDASTGVDVGANDFRISDIGPDGDDRFLALEPSVAYSPSANEYLVVWRGHDDTGAPPGAAFRVYGQRIGASTGAEVGVNDFRINEMGPGAGGPSVAYNPTTDEYLVVWEEFEIFAQRIDGSTGSEVGPIDFRISDMGPVGDGLFIARNPFVAYNPAADEYLVVWSGVDDSGTLVANEFEIYGQRIVTPPILSTPGPKMYQASLTLHQFTTALPVGYRYTYTVRPYGFVARPLGVRCNPLRGGKFCDAATFQDGAPLAASGTASVVPYKGRPAFFTLPQGALAATVTGSLPFPIRIVTPTPCPDPPCYTYYYGPITRVGTSAQASNASAVFAALGPDRSISSTPAAPGPGMHRVAIHGGPNRFGGTMRLLGHLGSKRQHPYPDVTNLHAGTGTSLLAYIGTGAVTGGGGKKAFGTFTYAHQSLTATTMAYLTAWNWSWTTGTVTATVSNGDGDPVVLQRAGYDKRTPAANYGTLQLVTPQIVHWDFPNRNGAPWDRNSAAIGILRIVFLPEPTSWLLLIAGAGLLGMLNRRRRP